MSIWSGINQIVVINVNEAFPELFKQEALITQSQIDDVVKYIIDEAPKIHGKEGDAEIFINRNAMTSMSFHRFTIEDKHYFYEVGTYYTITITGVLRGVTDDEVLKDWNRFKEYIKNIFHETSIDFPTDDSEVN